MGTGNRGDTKMLSAAIIAMVFRAMMGELGIVFVWKLFCNEPVGVNERVDN